MTEEEWHRFIWGRDPQIVTVCELNRDLCKALGAASPIVRMEHYYAMKAAHKHNLDTPHFPMIPLAIELGRCVLERPRCLTFFLFDEWIFGKWFHVSLETTREGEEVWVCTFHITRPGEVRRITRRGTLIRPEKT